MVQLKLGRLPDRTPIKLSISVLPDLHRRLESYAAHYAAAYGANEPLAGLIPAMLVAFLDSDRAFTKAERADKPEDVAG